MTSLALQGIPRTREETSVDQLPANPVAAHRCGMTRAPENTLAAARDTLQERPGTVLEFDVRALKDGTLVVNHDATVDRTAAGGKTGTVASMTVSEWRALRIKHPLGGPAVPAAFLQDFLDEYGFTNQVMLIELKDQTAPSQFIRQLWPYRKQVIVASFNPTVVSVLARSGFYTQQLVSGAPTPALVKGIYMAGISESQLTVDVVDYYHSHGVQLWAWGSTIQPDDDRYLPMGLDGFILDDPTH